MTPPLAQAPRPPPQDRNTATLERLQAARVRALPVVAALLRSIENDPPLALDAAVIKARRELDLLWQEVGRVTQPD